MSKKKGASVNVSNNGVRSVDAVSKQSTTSTATKDPIRPQSTTVKNSSSNNSNSTSINQHPTPPSMTMNSQINNNSSNLDLNKKNKKKNKSNPATMNGPNNTNNSVNPSSQQPQSSHSLPPQRKRIRLVAVLKNFVVFDKNSNSKLNDDNDSDDAENIAVASASSSETRFLVLISPEDTILKLKIQILEQWKRMTQSNVPIPTTYIRLTFFDQAPLLDEYNSCRIYEIFDDRDTVIIEPKSTLPRKYSLPTPASLSSEAPSPLSLLGKRKRVVDEEELVEMGVQTDELVVETRVEAEESVETGMQTDVLDKETTSLGIQTEPASVPEMTNAETETTPITTCEKSTPGTDSEMEEDVNVVREERSIEPAAKRARTETTTMTSGLNADAASLKSLVDSLDWTLKMSKTIERMLNPAAATTTAVVEEERTIENVNEQVEVVEEIAVEEVQVEEEVRQVEVEKDVEDEVAEDAMEVDVEVEKEAVHDSVEEIDEPVPEIADEEDENMITVEEHQDEAEEPEVENEPESESESESDAENETLKPTAVSTYTREEESSNDEDMQSVTKDNQTQSSDSESESSSESESEQEPEEPSDNTENSPVRLTLLQGEISSSPTFSPPQRTSLSSLANAMNAQKQRTTFQLKSNMAPSIIAPQRSFLSLSEFAKKGMNDASSLTSFSSKELMQSSSQSLGWSGPAGVPARETSVEKKVEEEEEEEEDEETTESEAESSSSSDSDSSSSSDSDSSKKSSSQNTVRLANKTKKKKKRRSGLFALAKQAKIITSSQQSYIPSSQTLYPSSSQSLGAPKRSVVKKRASPILPEEAPTEMASATQVKSLLDFGIKVSKEIEMEESSDDEVEIPLH